jgi:tellurite resistance protein TerC
MLLFPFEHYWWFYLGFTIFVLALLALDLGVFHKKSSEVSFKEATVWTGLWISLGLIFNGVLYFYAAWKFPAVEGQAKSIALEFLTGFLVEKSLAIDNIFVFAVVFSFLGIPKIYQHKILFYGILGALFFRAIFIALGSVLMQYHGVVIFFGVLLILTGIKMFFAPSKMMDPEKSIFMRILKRLFRVHPSLEGDRFFVEKGGVRYATPLFIALIFIELTDIIFAVDSVPAIFALTKEPLIVYTSNIFAILGMRSLYFMLAGVMARFLYIKYGLAAVLVFVGLKMVYLNEAFGGKFPITWSLGIIAALIFSSIAVSLWVSRNEGQVAKTVG